MATNDSDLKGTTDYRDNYMAGGPLLTGGGEWRPKNIINAISEIQQFYVIESKGQNIPVEFLTLEGTISFFKIGMGSGFNEGFLIFLLFPVFEFYMVPFVFHSPDMTTTLLFDSIPFSLLIGNTILCFYVSRYYVGTLTRKAINSLFVGRSSILAVKSFLMYVLYFSIVKLATPDRIWSISQHFNQDTARSVYSGILKILPHVLPEAAVCSIAMLLSAFLPYGSAYLLDHKRRRKLNKNQARVTGH